MPNITILTNNHNLPKFRLNKILAKLPQNATLKTNEVYFIQHNGELSNSSLDKLTALINCQVNNSIKLDSENIIIMPRLGTTSPWSSKATEILHRCGLTEIIRIEKAIYYKSNIALSNVINLLHDKMTESVIIDTSLINNIFNQTLGKTYTEIDILTRGKSHLEIINKEMGLALSLDEINYLYDNYIQIKRNPTDIELMMFAQANSEHCRHKIFNADFIINEIPQTKTLFQLIKDTYNNAPNNVLVAYNDNSSVIRGVKIKRFYPDYSSNQYNFRIENTHVLMKVETHNHPTAIAPYAGSATGSGGEIRDEGATGRGAKPKAGLTGFSVSNLKFGIDYSVNDKPNHIKSPLDIMIEAPVGGASFNNEFGRPNLLGYFRSFEQQIGNVKYGYHKPIMIAGGFGNINESNVEKQAIPNNSLIIQLGGPGFLIGLGGGSASSIASGENIEELDYNSVQRANPEMQRRCQEVIDTCSFLNEYNPILSIHDVGAGGLSNALPELVHSFDMGAKFELRNIPIYDTSMSPLEIWCNESQERYVLAINPDKLDLFTAICKRENCPVAIVGKATINKQLILNDKRYNNKPINIDIDILLGKPPKTVKDITFSQNVIKNSLNFSKINTIEAIYKILEHPTVASKSFLITIGDRSVGGMTVRDQLVGKWQVAVADCAITAFGYQELAGEVASIGERTTVATLNAAASGRLAIAESLTNIASCYIRDINDIKLSANWMASCGSTNQDALLYDTANAVSQLCQELKIAIPVGKDSLSMKMQWQEQQVISPISVIISAFATTPDIKLHKTPELQDNINSKLILLSLDNQQRIGASILQECYNTIEGATPDIDYPSKLSDMFKFIQNLHQNDMILAYHDKSDGGLIATLSEMIFVSRIGVDINIDQVYNLNSFLFNEEIGVVLQVPNNFLDNLTKYTMEFDIKITILGNINPHKDSLVIRQNDKIIIDEPRYKLQNSWVKVSHNIQKLRDNPDCADSELSTILDANNTGLFTKTTFNVQNLIAYPPINIAKPKVAILREQGINGHIEMAAAFVSAGFDAYDVHTNDILSGKFRLNDFVGIVACGGFSYGDVLGAGTGWAKSILLNPRLKDEFSHFFNRTNTFALGVCNGCQMMTQLKAIIPGSDNYPEFMGKNLSEQFEARLTMVEITPSPSILFSGMVGSQIPIVVSHGEGYAKFNNTIDESCIAMRYIDNKGIITETYPYNPNGSPQGITAITNTDGRFTIMMPHPERIHRTVQMSWHDKTWNEFSPWFKIFTNARDFVK